MTRMLVITKVLLGCSAHLDMSRSTATFIDEYTYDRNQTETVASYIKPSQQPSMQHKPQPSSRGAVNLLDEVKAIAGDGFSDEQIQEALRKCGNDVEAAVNLLFGMFRIKIQALLALSEHGLQRFGQIKNHKYRPRQDLGLSLLHRDFQKVLVQVRL